VLSARTRVASYHCELAFVVDASMGDSSHRVSADGRSLSQQHVDLVNTVSAHTSLSTASKLAVLRVAKAKAKTTNAAQALGNKVGASERNRTRACT
jgi:hypothetical protein